MNEAAQFAGHLVPVRFLLFALIGGFGVLTHLATLRLAVCTLWMQLCGGAGARDDRRDDENAASVARSYLRPARAR
jgi:hypothetical protein